MFFFFNFTTSISSFLCFLSLSLIKWLFLLLSVFTLRFAFVTLFCQFLSSSVFLFYSFRARAILACSFSTFTFHFFALLSLCLLTTFSIDPLFLVLISLLSLITNTWKSLCFRFIHAFSFLLFFILCGDALILSGRISYMCAIDHQY